MTTEQAITILQEMQIWRKGQPPYDAPGAKMPYSPADFGKAIDMAIEALKQK